MDLNGQFFLRPEIYYTSKGFAMSMEESESTGDYEISYSGESSITLNYLEVPVLGVFAVTKNFNLFAGPYLDIFLNGKTTTESEGYYRYLMNDEWIYEDLSGSDSEDIKSDDINTPGLGLLFGAEYVIGKFSFDVRYSMGLTNIPDEDDVDVDEDADNVDSLIYLIQAAQYLFLGISAYLRGKVEKETKEKLVSILTDLLTFLLFGYEFYRDENALNDLEIIYSGGPETNF